MAVCINRVGTDSSLLEKNLIINKMGMTAKS